VSFLDAAERFASLDRSQVLLDAKHCLHTQDQGSECAACFDICPVEAITAGKPPVLNAELCQSCLACLPTCPVGAYHADDDISSLLNCATHIEGQPVELLCGLHPHRETGADAESIGICIRGCLAGLGTGAYLALAAMGLTHIITRTDACRECKWGALSPEIHDQAGRANRFLSAWDRGDTVACVDELGSPLQRALWDAKNPPLSRRDMFRMLARQGQVTMARAMERQAAGSKRQPGRDRLRLLSAVSHLPAYSSAPAANFEGLDFAFLTVSESCTACGVCARACPTEALHFEKNEGETTFTLSFLPQNCIGCDLCAHVCAPGAIGLDRDPSFEQVFGTKEALTVQAGELVRCEHCKTLMAARPGVRLCQLCEYRRANPFGSKMPPGFKGSWPSSREPKR